MFAGQQNPLLAFNNWIWFSCLYFVDPFESQTSHRFFFSETDSGWRIYHCFFIHTFPVNALNPTLLYRTRRSIISKWEFIKQIPATVVVKLRAHQSILAQVVVLTKEQQFIFKDNYIPLLFNWSRRLLAIFANGNNQLIKK